MSASNIEKIYSLFEEFPKITTDTRKDLNASIFFALKGENFDANKFAEQALESGAEYAVIDNPDYNKSQRCILVKNVLRTLQELAKHHRQKLNITVIGITGSNGKTTTKELMNAVLSQKYNVCSTFGNLNNHIGVPLTVLSIAKTTELAIVEMGANHIGEIKELCEIAQPNYGIITNIGKAHLEGFGSYEGVKKAKSELYDYLKKREGTAFVHSDDAVLMQLSEGINCIYYGEKENDFCKGEVIELIPHVQVKWKTQTKASESCGIISSKLLGNYNYVNLLSAICIASYFGVKASEVDRILSAYEPKNNRSQLIQTQHNKIVMDAYNANPSSMAAAIQTCSRNFDQDVYFILGDMFELGKESSTEHKKIIELLNSIPSEKVLLIGKHFMQHREIGKYHFYENRNEAEQFLQQNPPNNSVILIKGSRGMELEKLLPLLP